MSSPGPLLAETVATAGAGTGARLVHSQHGVFAFGAAATVIVLESAVAAAALSDVDHAELVGPFPPEFIAVLQARTPIELFVRIGQGCLRLGAVFATRFGYRDGSTEPYGCDLEFVDPLPFGVVDLVRPIDPSPPPDLAWLDALPHDPSTALRRFVQGWFADIPPTEPYPQPTLALPRPLTDLYDVAAGRREVLGEFISIFAPPALRRLPDGLVTFGAECEGVWRLLLDPTVDDPPVFYDHDWPHHDGQEQRWTRERERLEAYLLQFVLMNVALSSPFGGFAFINADQALRLTAPLRPVPLQPTRWPASSTHLHVGPGLVVLVGQDDSPWRQTYVGARRSGWVRPVREPGFDWEHFRP